MTVPVRELIMQYQATALAAAADDQDGAFERNRVDRHKPAELPAWVLFDGGHVVETGDTGGIRRALNLDVDVYVTAASGAALGAAIGEQAALVSRTVRADITCGGLTMDVREVSMTDPDLGDGEGTGLFAEFSMRFLAIYETAEFDPYEQP